MYFDLGATAGTDNLATDLVTGSPVLRNPCTRPSPRADPQAGITTSAPVLGTPVLGQAHVLSATALTSICPVLGTPAVWQDHSLTATALVVGSPVLGTPSLSERRRR